MNRLDVLDREVAFWHTVADSMKEHGWRLGQAVFHAGIDDMPTLTAGSLVDPFHDDDRIGVFMERLRAQWLRRYGS